MWPSFLLSPKRPSSSLHFGQEDRLPGHSTERIVYWFALKVAWVFPIPSGSVGIGWYEHSYNS